VNPGELLQHWERGEIHVAIVTSNESLQNLFDIVGEPGQQWLRNTPLIVVSKRARQLAQELGAQQPVLLAGEASDEAIVETLLKWHQA
jgi:uroporphyrinogen-III synthase